MIFDLLSPPHGPGGGGGGGGGGGPKIGAVSYAIHESSSHTKSG